MVLQAELLQRYRERVERVPVVAAADQVRLVREATLHEVTALRADLMAKTTELIAATATLAEQGILNANIKKTTNMPRYIQGQFLHSSYLISSFLTCRDSSPDLRC